MQETTYGLRVVLPAGYDTAVERATAVLKAEGSGVLTTIDVQQTLRAKLNRLCLRRASQQKDSRAAPGSVNLRIDIIFPNERGMSS